MRFMIVFAMVSAVSSVRLGWVELPDCKGKKGETMLSKGLENATVANCKLGTEAPDYKGEEAKEALEKSTPKCDKGMKEC